MNKDSLIRFIQSTQPLSPAKAGQIADMYLPKKILKNELVLKESHVCNESYFVESGLMRAYIYDLDGNDVTIAFYSKNTLGSDMFSFFQQVRSKENIQALTDCDTWYINYATMQESFHAIPEFRDFGRSNLINNYGALQQRMLSMLQQTAEQRYLDLVHSNPEIFQIAPLKTIATYLGITDTSLSRIRRELSKNSH